MGGTVGIGGVPHTVVGVMPADFLFPEHEEMWLPLRERPTGVPGAGSALQVFGRLADGVTEESAQTELSAVGRSMAIEFPDNYARLDAEVVSFTVGAQGWPKGGLRTDPGVWLFQVLALVLLGVACANVGLLIFARTATRSSELAVRTALGASRMRIVGQVFTEALVLAVVAAGVGLLIIDAVPNRLMAAMRSPTWGGPPWWIDLGVTGGTMVRAMVLAVFSAGLAAVVPALSTSGQKFDDVFSGLTRLAGWTRHAEADPGDHAGHCA